MGEEYERWLANAKVLRSNDTWYGMTYKEDVEAVKASFKKMLDDGIYKEDLFADLQKASDYLTEQVRLYVMTGEEKYLNNFFVRQMRTVGGSMRWTV